MADEQYATLGFFTGQVLTSVWLRVCRSKSPPFQFSGQVLTFTFSVATWLRMYTADTAVGSAEEQYVTLGCVTGQVLTSGWLRVCGCTRHVPPQGLGIPGGLAGATRAAAYSLYGQVLTFTCSVATWLRMYSDAAEGSGGRAVRHLRLGHWAGPHSVATCLADVKGMFAAAAQQITHKDA